MKPKRIIHGDDLLYRFFQDSLRDKPEIFAAVPQLLISNTAIWLPIDMYERWPILLPWVVRDPKCRGNAKRGLPDRWSSPDSNGYLRDDNSLVKSLPRALRVRGPDGSYVDGARMGSEFVASHAWRRIVKSEQLASRIPLLNTFVPNLVWLPNQVAKLTDREGGIVQQTLQAMAYQIYRKASVNPVLRDIVEIAWTMLPEPQVKLSPFRLNDLNWFEVTCGFYRTRSSRLGSVVEALEALELGRAIPKRVVTTRYAAGLPFVDRVALSHLKSFLLPFTRAIKSKEDT